MARNDIVRSHRSGSGQVANTDSSNAVSVPVFFVGRSKQDLVAASVEGKDNLLDLLHASHGLNWRCMEEKQLLC